jgi:Kef-type K+ transport system membrane component KefB/nucleotide-binding universal stress UspA family protein
MHFFAEPLPRFMLQLAVIIAVSRVIALGLRRIHQPSVIAEIIAGILLGPSLLGWLSPELSQVLFPAESLGSMQLVAQLGLALFMFVVGLEFDSKYLRGHAKTSIWISHTSIIVPFVLGAAFAVVLHRHEYGPPGVAMLPFALFLGVAMSITAFPVLARILNEQHLLRTRLGTITIACAAVDDVTAWCLLAFVVATARATGISGALVTTVLAIGYILVMLMVLRPFLARVAARVDAAIGPSQGIVALTVVLTLGSALLTEWIGIHALFGAFVFGAVIPKDRGFAQSIAGKLEDPVAILLLPLFFAYSGLRTEIGSLDSPIEWTICGVIVAIAVTGKLGGSALAARYSGLSWRESGALGILMNTRGLMELIVLNIALDLGVIDPTFFTMMVIMALVTTFMTTPLLRWIYPSAMMAADLVEPVEMPAHATPAFTVLACPLEAQTARSMHRLAAGLGGDNSLLVAVHVTPPSDRYSDQLDPIATDEQTADRVLAAVREGAEAVSIAVRTLAYTSLEPADDIVSLAEVRDADLIVLEGHRPLFSNSWLGGIVGQVVERAHNPVGILFDRKVGEIRRVLVPYLGTAHDRLALHLAERLMTNVGARITVLHVIRPRKYSNWPLTRESARATLESFRERHGEVVLKTIEHESPVLAALSESTEGYDLVVVGLHPEWDTARAPFGLQPERLIQHCPTNLLVVHANSREDRAAARVRDESGSLTEALPAG